RLGCAKTCAEEGVKGIVLPFLGVYKVVAGGVGGVVGEVGGGAAEEGGEEEQEAESDEPGHWVAHVSSIGRGPAGRNGTWVLADEEELCVALACGSVGAADGLGGDCDHAEAGGV